MLLNSSRSTFVLSSHILFIIQDQTFVSTWSSAVHGFPLHHLAFIEVELNFMAYMQGCSTASSEDMTKNKSNLAVHIVSHLICKLDILCLGLVSLSKIKRIAGLLQLCSHLICP